MLTIEIHRPNSFEMTVAHRVETATTYPDEKIEGENPNRVRFLYFYDKGDAEAHTCVDLADRGASTFAAGVVVRNQSGRKVSQWSAWPGTESAADES